MVMDATPPSPQSVGREFVRQYYTLLNKAPAHLHRFYNNFSSFVHGGLDTPNRETLPVVGQKQIHNRIQQLNFRDCHAKISQVDSQATLGNGVVVQVTGELSNGGAPMRRFTQTFVLAAQSPKQYYVHNDIFRYQDFVFSEEDAEVEAESGCSAGEDEPAPAAPAAQPQPPPTVAQPPPAALPTPYFPPATSYGAAGGSLVSAAAHLNGLPPPASAPAPLHHSPPPPLDNSAAQYATNSQYTGSPSQYVSNAQYATNPTGAQYPSQNAASHLVGGTQHLPQALSGMAESGAGDAVEVAPLPPVQDYPPALEPELVVEPLQYQPPPPQEPVLPPAPPEPKTYANLLKSGGNYQPQVMQARPAPPPTSRAPPQSSGGAGAAPADGQPPAPQRMRPPRPHRPDTYNDGGSGPIRRYSDSQQLFLGNLPHTATEEELRVLFAQFGVIAELRVQSKMGPGGARHPNYGFITFEEPQAVQNCLNARPLFFPPDSADRQKLNVEEKKPKSSSGSTGGAPRGGVGRGGARAPRPPFGGRGGGVAPTGDRPPYRR